MNIQSLQIIVVSFVVYVATSIILALITLIYYKKLKMPFVFLVIAIALLISLIVFSVTFYNTITQLGKYFI